MDNPNGHIDDYPEDDDEVFDPYGMGYEEDADEPGMFYQYEYDVLPDDDVHLCPRCEDHDALPTHQYCRFCEEEIFNDENA